MKTLKEFKKEIKSLGYQAKTNVDTFRHLSVYKDNHFIGGSGANVYPAEHITKHKAIFDLLTANRGLVFDDDYNPALKVLF